MMIHRHTPTLPSRARGATLVEILIGFTLLALMLGSIGVVSLSSQSAFCRGTTRSSVELRSGIAIDAILSEFEIAMASSLTPALTPGTPVTDLTFTQAVNWVDSETVPGPPRRLVWELDPAEANNGGDDDGDGLVDEGQLVLVTDVGLASEDRRVLARGVAEYAEGEAPNGVDDNGDGLIDEPGFMIEGLGNALDVTLTIEDATADGEEVVWRTVRTSILLRN